jgi:uncharacterized membrane protein
LNQDREEKEVSDFLNLDEVNLRAQLNARNVMKREMVIFLVVFIIGAIGSFYLAWEVWLELFHFSCFLSCFALRLFGINGIS